MNRSTDTRNPSGGLPSFLGSDAQEDQQTQTATAAEPAEDEDLDVGCAPQDVEGLATGEGDDFSETESAGEYEDDDADYDESEEEEDDAPEQEVRSISRAARRPVSRSRRRYQPTPPAAGGGFAMGVGLLATVAGLLTAYVPAAGAALNGTIEPQIITLIGIAVFAIGAAQRRVARLQQRLDSMEQQRANSDQELRETMAQLLEHGSQPSQPPQPSSDTSAEVQQMMLSLQRQDQKINNLTKAIKMYGKPLMEIAGQGTELAGSVSQVKTLIEGSAETTRQAVNRLEQQIRNRSAKTDLGELPGQMTKLEVGIAAITQRIEDTEVRKSLVRLEDASKSLQEEIHELGNSDAVREATSEVQQAIEKATQGLGKGIDQLRDGNLGGLETSVKDIQRELSGLATSMAQVQAAVKNGIKASGGSAPAQPAVASVAASGASKPSPQGSGGTTKAASGGEDGSGYSTGKRNTGGKNVLGAIAKLKQMKG